MTVLLIWHIMYYKVNKKCCSGLDNVRRSLLNKLFPKLAAATHHPLHRDTQIARVIPHAPSTLCRTQNANLYNERHRYIILSEFSCLKKCCLISNEIPPYPTIYAVFSFFFGITLQESPSKDLPRQLCIAGKVLMA